MKTLFLFLFVPFFACAQLNVEWTKEFDIPHSNLEIVSALIVDDEVNTCAISNVSGTFIYQFTSNSEPVKSYSISNYVWWFSKIDQQIVSRETNCLRTRSYFSGVQQSEICYTIQENWPATSPVSILHKGSLYYTENNMFCKLNPQGNIDFKKYISDYGDAFLIKESIKGIYIYGSYNSIGRRLMQYDTLGNQNWSIGAGDVRNILADEMGNCYVLAANDETTVTKYGTSGEVLWSKVTPGQWSRGSFLRGDSLFVCGNVSPGAMTDQKQPCAYTIMSASTGKIISQQVITISEDRNVMEHFSRIASDGKNIYIGGSQGNQYPKCFLLKLSKEGNTTGIKEQTGKKSFIIFPNPSGSKFTISCSEQGTNSLKVIVRNSLGQVVHKDTLSCNDKKSYELDLGKQAAGNYTVEIESGKDKVVKKLVVE